jgi:putative cell wall-binding protein
MDDVGPEYDVFITPDGAKAFMLGGSPDGDYLHSVVQVIDLHSIGWAPAVKRIAGDDRIATSVQVSRAGFPGKAPVVYVATGDNFPDALSAAPAAAHDGGPLLLTGSSHLRDDVKAEIKRLAPAKIVVVGGTAAVSIEVYSQLSALAPSIARVAGADRYETSEAIASRAFGESIDSAYVATGLNYPDALSASAAAGAQGAPIILVNGAQPRLGVSTVSYLTQRGTSSFTIVGGTNAVTAGVESSLSSLGAVKRIGGDDRFATSQLINEAEFPGAHTSFIATGQDFPDALSGATLAARSGSPLYVIPPTCIPIGIEDDLAGRDVSGVTLLGGQAALSDRVAQLAIC